MRKALSTLAMLVLMTSLAIAQTTTTRTLNWEYENTSPAEIAGWAQTVKVNGTTLTGAPTCTASGVNTTCQMPLVGLNATANNAISVMASNDNGSYEAIINYNPSIVNPGEPKLPTDMKIKVTVTVVIGGTK